MCRNPLGVYNLASNNLLFLKGYWKRREWLLPHTGMIRCWDLRLDFSSDLSRVLGTMDWVNQVNIIFYVLLKLFVCVSFVNTERDKNKYEKYQSRILICLFSLVGFFSRSSSSASIPNSMDSSLRWNGLCSSRGSLRTWHISQRLSPRCRKTRHRAPLDPTGPKRGMDTLVFRCKEAYMGACGYSCADWHCV